MGKGSFPGGGITIAKKAGTLKILCEILREIPPFTNRYGLLGRQTGKCYIKNR